MTNPAGKGTNPDTLGGGFLKMASNLHASVQVAPEDLSIPSAEEVDKVAIRKQRKARSIKLAVMGMSSVIMDKADPRYRNAILMANKYRRVRSRELSELHGSVSVGASALLASASLALAASRYLYEKYAEDGGGAFGIGMLKQAAQMADSARQSELAAWEMSSREGLVKRKQMAVTAQVPWIERVDGNSLKEGRKTNEQKLVEQDGTEVLLPDAG